MAFRAGIRNITGTGFRGFLLVCPNGEGLV